MALKEKRTKTRRLGLTPGTIAVLYAAFSAVWIWGTDIVVNAVEDRQLRLFLVTSKGLTFVFVTAVLLFLLVRKLVRQMRQAQQSLAASEAEYRGVIEAANEGVCRLTPEDRIGFVNPRMADMLQRSEEALRGLLLSDFLDGVEQSAYAEQLKRWRSGATEQHDFRFCAADGVEIRTLVSGTPVFDYENKYSGCILMLMDVTERQRIQEQLQNAQKLEAVGRFAGGIAHDFNNVLGIIISYATLLKARIEPDKEGREYADIVLHSCERAASLVRQLLAFSRHQPLVLSVIDLNTSVAEFGKLVPRFIGEDISVTIRTGAEAATVRADPVQIEQVLLNLASNARDAMPQGGELLIESGAVQSKSVFDIEDMAPGEYCCLRVTDSGVGMDEETRSRIFEPFFTTKEVGKGTGLGLSMVYGIVKQSHGYISVASQPMRGTTFSIYLPFAEAAKRAPVTPERVSAPHLGNETILLVEDESELRMVTKYILVQNGYQVIEATNGIEALAICEKRLPEIDLVMTDLVMPEMGGRELASRLMEIKPTLKIVFVTGYADDSPWGEPMNGSTTIEKPIRPSALLQKIRQILDAEDRRATG